MPERSAPLWQPGTIGSLTLPHRIVMGSMHLGLEALDDGGAALAAFYVERARGGAGLMITGGAAISPLAVGGRGYGVLSDPAFQARLASVVQSVHEADGLIALQLFHAGRYAVLDPDGPPPVAPSPVFSRLAGREPTALTDDQVRGTVDDFARAAGIARQLGFDAVEVMGSEGYLIDQFLSPLTNHRDDAWGGDATRRTRFGLEVTRAVRSTVGPTYPVIVRFSGADLMPDGTSTEQALDFARGLADAGADALNIGVGWHESRVPTVQGLVPPGVWVPVAAAIKQAVGATTVIASNRINRLDQAAAVLDAGQVDLVSMARPFLADPRLIARARAGQPVNVCIGCNQACIDRSLADSDPSMPAGASHTVSCLVNPRAGQEWRTVWIRTRRPGQVGVIGGGPAGLQAARELASAGHRVTLFEAADQLGGQFRLASQVPGKADYASTVDYFAAELDRFGVTVELGRRITEADLELLRGFDGLIIASGVRPRSVNVPGADLAHVVPYPEAFARPRPGERIVIIGGGGIAVDLAHRLSHRRGELNPAEQFRLEHRISPLGSVPAVSEPVERDPNEPDPNEALVTILQRGRRLGPALGRSSRWAVLAELRRHGVRTLSEVSYQQITPESVDVVDADGTRRSILADRVVIAAGQEQDDTVPALARQCGIWHRLVGGARDVAGLDAVRAFAEGYAAAGEFDATAPRLSPA